VNETELLERVESFRYWHYQFDLNGVRTRIWDPKHVNRHEQRKNYFFAPLVQLCGGSLAGKRVLDLGCNAGFWSLSAIEAGAEFVLGVDGRKMHIDQAELVFEIKGVEVSRYRFELSDVFDLDLTREDPFDVVLCLGLLYHVSKPIELMERLAAWNSDLLVIDTDLVRARRSSFQLISEDVNEARSAVDRGLVLIPSSRAVRKLARAFGYSSVKMLRPRFTSWEGSSSYRNGTRRAFICAKRTALDGLRHEPFDLLSGPIGPHGLRLLRRARRRARRALGKLRP
jgi:tRNA (mo5U34)-methyltransferase